MSKRPMIALCITAITMLVTEAAADCPPHQTQTIGGSLVCPYHAQFVKDQTRMTSEFEAELATLITEAIANDKPILIEIPGYKPRDQGLSGKRERVVQQQVQEMLKALNREPDSVRVFFNSTSAIQKSTLYRPGKSGHRPSGN